MIDPRIFRAYDIRGVAGTQLTEEACLQIGFAFGQVLLEKYGKEHPKPTVVVGRDARTHSPGLQAEVMKGLIAAGCEVFDIGQTPSPVNYFTICTKKFDAGMQITASHNPKEDNGIKLCTRDADAFSGPDLQDLRSRIEKTSVFPSLLGGGASGGGRLDTLTPYITHLTKLFANVGKGKKIVVDGGNGVAGPCYCEVLRKVGCEVIELYTEPDGTFPNHAADPSKHATLKELQAKVLDENADCGFAFDGDGDRMGLVDEKGQIVTADQTLLLLAQDHLSRHNNAPVIFTVSNSSLLETEVTKWGGKPVMCKVGHSYVEHAMREHKALLGGEQSGHFFCGEDYFGFDDAMVAGLRILAILAKPSAGSHVSRHALHDWIANFPIVFQSPERRPHCPDDKKAEVVGLATEHFQKMYPTTTLDGARIDFGDGAWAGIRSSNTSPCLSICIEARSEKKLKEVEEEVLEEVRKYVEVK
ncbi:phosphomannomutase/phosphoglucomutase [Candidatus Peribacteria bacterium]|nr:phosphomannomutase/phosphoglucomutase [Candidatus Peribacteria bacterium]